MSYIAFVSTFPTEANMRDGYFRRVHHVDQVFSDENRIHLDIRFCKNGFKHTDQRDNHMQVMHLNAFFHFFRILSVLRNSGVIYIHSIAKVPSIWLQLMILKNRVPLVLDLHGVMIDERKLAGRSLAVFFYSIVEKFCFRWCRVTVNVSEVMKNHFSEKYPDFKGDAIVFPANSADSHAESEDPVEQVELKKELGFKADDVILLYSGNCQKWQNIELMMEMIRKHQPENYKYLILSGQKSRFEKLIHHYHIREESIKVLSVKPEDLWKYYQLAHYGFILRDDILVNRVANPTKLAEYLQYGIIPVVKLAEIGDFAMFDYEYVHFENLSGIKPVKSLNNKMIYSEMNRLYSSNKIRTTIKALISKS